MLLGGADSEDEQAGGEEAGGGRGSEGRGGDGPERGRPGKGNQAGQGECKQYEQERLVGQAGEKEEDAGDGACAESSGTGWGDV